MDEQTLNPREQLFVIEYLKDLNAVRAGLRAGYGLRTEARLMRRPAVLAAIEAAKLERNERLKLSVDNVVKELVAISQVDANELIEHRRVACRYCHGTDFHYQRTARERREAFAEHTRRVDEYQTMVALVGADNLKDPGEFNELGGVGFDKRREPHEDCPECNGEGLSETFVHDTRLLSPAAKSLYAGVKETKDGIEIKMHSKDKTLELLGRHLGIFNDKLDLNVKKGLAEKIVNARKRLATPNDGSDLV